MGRRPLVRRRWRCGSPFPARRGMPPPAPRPPRSPRQSRLRSRTVVRPVVPREPRKVSRGRRAAASGCHLQPIPSRPGASVSIRPCRLQCGDMAHPCRRGASPHAIRNTWPRVAWHLGVASRKLRLPRPCRTSTGRLSSSLSGVTSRQRGRGATNGRRQITPGTKAAPRRECLAALPPLAATPIWRPVTTEFARPLPTPRGGAATLCDSRGSDGARRLATRAGATPPLPPRSMHGIGFGALPRPHWPRPRTSSSTDASPGSGPGRPLRART